MFDKLDKLMEEFNHMRHSFGRLQIFDIHNLL